jgi:FdhD protein
VKPPGRGWDVADVPPAAAAEGGAGSVEPPSCGSVFRDQAAQYRDQDWPDHRPVRVVQLMGEEIIARGDTVIDEAPVALIYNHIPHAVMLVTPTCLDDFALGFSLGEGILESADELHACAVVPAAQGIELRLTIARSRFAALKEHRRTLMGRSGCGLCGVETLAALERPRMRVGRACEPQPGAVVRALARLPAHQPLFRLTGGGHAAAWVRGDGEILLVREDVGRHNALDKLIGALLRGGGFVPWEGFAICTSRASYEMVQKAMSAGIGLLVAVSAPTAAAIRLADLAGMTLIGFARGERMLVYTHPRRLPRLAAESAAWLGEINYPGR